MSTTTTTARASKASKATTTNTKEVKAMTPAEMTTTAAALLVRFKTIKAVKATAASLREKYGADNWEGILSRCKELRGDAIKDAAEGARAALSYRAILGAGFGILKRDAAFKALCRYASATYKGTDTDAAAALVRDYAAAVDAVTGAPLVRVRYLSKGTTRIFEVYESRELTDAVALAVLKDCLNGLKAGALKASRKGTDGTQATRDNQRTPGAVVAVYRAVAGDTIPGTIKAGAVLTGDKASKAASAAKAVKVASALLGKPVPAGAVLVSEYNAKVTKDHRAKAEKALQDLRAAVAADATAAGLKTAPETPRKVRPVKGAPLAGDAFISANKAAAKADAVALNA